MSNGGFAFKNIGFIKYLTLVVIDDVYGVVNTSYSSKKYFKCYETVVKSWPAPALQQLIPENSTVQADEILSVDPIIDVEKYIFRLYDLNGNEIVKKEDTVSQFDLSEVVGEIVYDSTYLLEVSSKIGTSEGPRSQQLPIRISDVVQDNYYSIESGNWKNPNVWSKSPGGAPSGFIPKKEDVIHINGHQITLTDSAECDVVNVYSSDISSSELLIDGGVLEINSQIEIDDTTQDYMGYVKVKNNGALLVKEIVE
jgi:hypothetical protein